MRGGQSARDVSILHWLKSSPHAWGSVCGGLLHLLVERVSPTHVGVCRPFPGRQRSSWDAPPPTHGGFSQVWDADHVQPRSHDPGREPASSPHTWGSARADRADPTLTSAFPTHVGVVPSSSTTSPRSSSPHPRGYLPGLGYRTRADQSSSRTWGSFLADGFGTVGDAVVRT
jgi:hypothetical protein